MNNDQPVAPGQNDVEQVDTDQNFSEQDDLIGADAAASPAAVEPTAAADAPASVASSVTGARPPSPSASRTQSRITVAALLTFAASVVLLVVSIVQHG